MPERATPSSLVGETTGAATRTERPHPHSFLVALCRVFAVFIDWRRNLRVQAGILQTEALHCRRVQSWAVRACVGQSHARPQQGPSGDRTIRSHPALGRADGQRLHRLRHAGDSPIAHACLRDGVARSITDHACLHDEVARSNTDHACLHDEVARSITDHASR
jgi:hypothetical protein